MKTIKMTTVALLALTFAGCASVDKFITNVDNTVNTYAPIVGRDLIMVGDILVTAECSPVTQIASQTAVNILNITAPNTSAATTVQNFFTINSAVASQLCPLVSAIKTAVGSVPQGNPTQVIPVTPAQKAALHWRRK